MHVLSPDSRSPANHHVTSTRLDRWLPRLSGVLALVGAITMLAAGRLVPLPPPANRTVINLVAGLTAAGAAPLILIPWHRFHRELVFIHTCGAVVLMAILVANTGGAGSPFMAYYFPITLFSALYFRRPLALLGCTLVAGATLLPLLGGAAGGNGPTQLLLALPVHFSLALIGRFVAGEFGYTGEEVSETTDGRQQPEAVIVDGATGEDDPLTRLPDRAALAHRFDELLASSRGAAGPFSLLLLDIDHFKQLNARYGRASGDDLIRQVAALLQSQLRNSDVTARLRGTEFVILLPGASAETALMLGERLRSAVEQHRFWSPSNFKRHALTVSLGVASYPHDGASMEAMLAHADASLELARRGGHNQVRWLRQDQPATGVL